MKQNFNLTDLVKQGFEYVWHQDKAVLFYRESVFYVFERNKEGYSLQLCYEVKK